MAPAPDLHFYLSTACLHEGVASTKKEKERLRKSCRFFCKFCPAPCQCPCHDGATEPFPGFDAETEDALRQELRAALTEAGIPPGARSAELLVDIVTGVLHRIDADAAGDAG